MRKLRISRTLAGAALASAFLSVAAVPAVAGTSVAQVSAAHPQAGYHRACAVTHRAGVAACMVLVRDGTGQRAVPGQAPTGDGYGPSSLISAYHLPAATAVRKVAVVDAYNDPNAVADLAAYRKAWGLAKCNTSTEAGCLTVTNQNGKASPLPANAGTTGWATEESLDVDMVAAICPRCHVYLVEANSPTAANLGTGVDSAVSVLGAGYVSNSYGEAESSGETKLDKYYNHLGVIVTAAAGDDGYGVSYPAASPYVLAVGGTTLTKASGTTRGWKETVWGSSSGGEGTGSGCSKYEPKQSWQTHSGCSHRIDNDVAAVANPDTGVAVYDTYDQAGWLEVGGTSVAAPIIASIATLTGPQGQNWCTSSDPYGHQSSLYDVTKGVNGVCTPAFLCTAETGYDGPSGLGTPNGSGAFDRTVSGPPC